MKHTRQEKPKDEKNPHPGQEKLTPVTALMSSTKPKLGAEKCIDGIEDGKDSQAGDKVNLCHTLVKKETNLSQIKNLLQKNLLQVKKEGDKFIAEPFPWFAIDYGEEARVSVGKTVLVNRLVSLFLLFFLYLG